MQHLLEYSAIGIYSLFMVGLGIVLAHQNRNVSDYVRAGGQGSWWLVGSSAFMSSFSAYTFTANGSLAYRGGPTALIIFFAIACGLFVCAIWVGPWIRQTRAITLPDIIRDRFGPEVEQFYTYTGVFFYPLTASIQLWALSVFGSSVFGFPLLGTIVVLGIVVVAYSTTGGRWAVMATDFVQGLIVVPIALLVAYLCIDRVGGIVPLLERFSRAEYASDFRFVKEEGQFATNLFTWDWIAAMFLFLFCYEVSLIQAYKYLPAKNGAEARKSALLSMCLMLFGGVVFLLPPMVARFEFSDHVDSMQLQNPAEAAYVVAAMQVLPNGFVGLLVIAMFGATQSSMCTGLNEATGQIVHNLLPALRQKLGRQPFSERASMITCRFVTVCLGALSITYALLFASDSRIDIFGSFTLLSSVLVFPITLPFVFCIFIKKLPRWSYFLIMGFALLPSIFAELDRRFNNRSWDYQDKILWIMAFGSVALLISRLAYVTSSLNYRQRVAAFFLRMKTPIGDEEVSESQDFFQLRLMGNASLIASGLLSLMLLVPNSINGRMCVAFLVGFVAVVGTLLKWVAGHRTTR
jgi:Na+/proline symporter